jgi:hypothetical protein
MNKNIKMFALVVLLTLSTTAFGTLLLEENFSYTVGTLLTANGWSAHSGAGSNPVLVTTPGLTYAGYTSSGIGEATTISGGSGSREDVNKAYGAQTSGIVYVATMVNVNAAVTTNDYFFHLGPNTIGSAFVGRVHVKQDGSGNVAFGLGKGSSDTVYTGFTYALNTTYLLVLKYEIITGTTNDIVSLFIFTSGAPTNEPGTPTLGPQSPASTDPVDIGSVALRQATQAYTVQVDGIRVGTSWSDVLPPQGGTPTQLVITSVNNNTSPSVNTPFSVIVQAQDALGAAANVTATTGILLSLATGSGSLSGTLTGQIEAGSNSVTITGVTYNIAQPGVSITATRTSGNILTPGTSALFIVLPAASQLAFVGVPATALPGIAMDTFTVQARRPDSTVDLNYTGSVTVAKVSGPGNVTGTLTKVCVAGVATFTDVVCSAPGAYTLNATATGLTTAISSTINVITLPFPLIENFEYTAGTSLVSNGWTAHSSAGSNPVMVVTPGLTYAGYASSGIGNAAKVDTAGEDVNKIFAAQTSGTVYTAFMMNVQKATTIGDYCLHLSTLPLASTEFVSRLHIKRDASNNLALGLGKRQSDTTFTTFSGALNTTYLVVIKYEIIAGDSNDRLSLFVGDSGVPSTEPTTPTIGPITPLSTDPSNIGSIALRQGSAANASRVIIDGIRIAASWSAAIAGIEDNRLPLTANRISLAISPNPFRNFTNVSFNVVPKDVRSIKIYDVVGNVVRVLSKVSSNMVIWDGKNEDGRLVTAGVYFIKLATNQQTKIAKLLLVR